MSKMREEHLKIRETATKKIDEILTEEQKAAFEKMLGKPFDFSKIGPPGRGPAAASSTRTGSRTQVEP
jgi:hypothetical protein